MKEIKIGNHIISDQNPCFIIAELSANHLNDFELARKTIYKMKESGADCVKLQTSKPNSITIDCNKQDFIVSGGTAWDGRSLYNLYQETYTPWEWHKPIQKLVNELGMVFFSSPFDREAVDFLEDLNVPAYKIASFEITDIPLIRYAASKGKPMIISTGIAEDEDIKGAIDACYTEGNEQVILLKCTSSYPTPIEEVNLNMISTIREKYKCHVGLSDHTLGSNVPVGAAALGARVIEKHFILNRSLGGPDSGFSMEPEEFKTMVDAVREIQKSLGRSDIYLSEKNKKSRSFARSLYVVEDIKKGEVFSENNVRSIRPGFGLHPKNLPDILGKVAKYDIEKGTRFSLNLILD